MGDRSKNKFTVKIVVSYLILATLALVVGFFIFSEIRVYLYSDTLGENDTKLLKTGSLLTELYEAESLSKLALQTKTKDNFNAYAQKIDSISIEIDTLKQLTDSDYQKGLLDSVQTLLQQKVANSNELRNLKVRNDANNYSIDNALKEFDKIEESFGKFSAENLFPNFDQLSPKVQKSLREYAALINNNAPKNPDGSANTEYIDSILSVSKSLLTEAKLKDSRTQRSLAKKETEINRNDLVLSQQLRSIISAFENEVMVNTYNDNIKKQTAVRRSMRLAGFAALLGFVIVGIFTFLINRDFWKVQTYRQKLEKEKKFSESLLKSREQLISTVSHDLRTPLNTITGYSELMENTRLDEKQADYIKNVKSASQYVDSLVNDLLDFSKLEAGKIKVEKIPFNLSDLITETAEGLKEINQIKPIALILEIDEKLKSTVLGDPFRIRQILTNLISNAYKFTSEGYIKVQAKVKKEANDTYITIIKVVDTGIGIKKEKQELIFREFAQADEHTEKKYGGYGLGLTISKKLTELLGGSLRLKSEEGKGSTFSIMLPLEISEEPVLPMEKNLKKPKKGLSIVIIDDDTAMLRLLKEVCDSLGIKAKTYSDFTMMEPRENLRYDIVLTDIQMPNISGFEVLENLKTGKYQHFKNQPVVAMTGRRDLKTKVYKDAGFSNILQKPFTKTQFLEILGDLFPNRFLSKIGRKEEKKAKKHSNLFNLEVVSSFLGENQEAIEEVLQTFMADTSVNMEQLKENMELGNFEGINNTTHRMLPMFRQLKADEIVPILERLETIKQNETDSKKLKSTFSDLKNKITALQLALKSYLATSPSYSG